MDNNSKKEHAIEECKQRHSSAMGYGCRGGDTANDRKKEQVVEEYKQQVSCDWKSETEDRAYCFGSVAGDIVA